MQKAKPVIVAIVGLPFVGKTTLGKRLAEQAHFCYLSVEVARKEVEQDHFDSSRRKNETLEQAIMLEAYQHNHALARKHLLATTSVILDATYSRPVYHTMLIELAKETGARLVVFRVVADSMTIRSRIKIRPKDSLSNVRTMSGYKSVARRYRLIDCPNLITVDTTTLSVESAVGQMRDAVYSSHEKE